MGAAMIYCIGRNYAAHAKELGNVVSNENPVVFFKPPASVAESGTIVKLPSFSKNLHYELELAVKVGSGFEITEFTVGNDLTARDKQREAQEKKTPWALAKGFKQSCGLGPWVSAVGVNLMDLEMKLTVNGQLKQHGFTKDMIFDLPQIIKYLRECFPLEPGDIILTGTPEGVGAVVAGDEVVAEIKGYCEAQWKYE